jgi:hypothetical protein
MTSLSNAGWYSNRCTASKVVIARPIGSRYSGVTGSYTKILGLVQTDQGARITRALHEQHGLRRFGRKRILQNNIVIVAVYDEEGIDSLRAQSVA